ncbi:MAG: sigma 54-interacting transcriptional regulator [Pseudobacteriovorax sp.]|nr:sigma 54-interacting transcriptional regulator [Pseudobacteriovorax sp.]
MGVDSTKFGSDSRDILEISNPKHSNEQMVFSNVRNILSDIKGVSSQIDDVLTTVAKVARSDSPVLINGESGTGKELIARGIHRLSQRVSKPFVAINCSAIPENLLESELFGHVKGAFTGADSRRKGYFEEAAGGSIFLDEIGEMPWRLQSKLLRVLQEKQFTPVGSSESKIANVRVIAATNVDLEKAIAAREFRLDLYYRLNVLPLQIPALRQRVADIPVLLEYFISQANRQHNYSNPSYMPSEVVKVLETHNWPGNVRELQNLVERLVVITGGGKISVDDLPPEYRHAAIGANDFDVESKAQLMRESEQDSKSSDAPGLTDDLLNTGMNLTAYIENLENKLILQALEKTGNNKNQAAKLLGLNRTTLVERIKKRKLAPLNSPSREL